MGKVVKLESKQRPTATPCTRLQLRRASARKGSPLTPELKGFIDRVVVPILVRDYLSGMDQKKQIADRREDVASCDSMNISQNAEAER